MAVHRIYTLCFFLSGAAGLVYQIAWIRVLSLVFGATVYAVSMVVAGFMTGLALGSHYWGKRADKFANPVGAYVKLEIGVAISALVVSSLIGLLDDTIISLMTPESVASGHWQLIRYVVIFMILLVPTALMGGTLPVMSKFYVQSFDKVGLGIGSLYAANTYGAVAGCFVTGFALIRFLGVWGAIVTAIAINLLVAVMVWMVPAPKVEEKHEEKKVVKPAPAGKKSTPKQKRKKRKGYRADEPAEPAGYEGVNISLGYALALGAVSGFCALSYEILWTRGFVVSFKSTVYLFSNLLAVYLLGMALGSHYFSRRLDTTRDPMRMFGLAQVGIGAWGILGILIFYKIPDFALDIGGMLGAMSLSRDIMVTLALMILTFAIPVFLMGLSYPLVCRVTTGSMGALGRYTGLVYAVGTSGGIAGTLVSGFFLLPTFGLQTSLIVISCLSIAVGYAALVSANSRKGVGWVFPASALFTLVVIGSVGISGIDIGLGASVKDKVVFSEEGVMGSVRVTQKSKNGPMTLLVNNYQLATSGDVAVRFGHVPLLIKSDAKDVLLISLGSGITAGSVGKHDVERIDCVEIVPSLLDAQRLFERDNHNIVADKRFNLTFWDGRHYTRMTKRKYDLVISDLFQPDSAGVGSLYALEHFMNVKQKLKKNGAMAQWLPLYQLSPDNLKIIMRTFATAFEHVMVWAGDVNSSLPTLMLLGSRDPIVIAPDSLMKGLEEERVAEDMIETRDPLSFLSFFVMDREKVMKFTEGYPVNTDNRPIIEYTAPGHIWSRGVNSMTNFRSIINNRSKIALSALGANEDEELEKAIDRYFEGRTRLLQGKAAHAARNYPGELNRYKEAYKFTPTDPFLALAVFDLGYMYFYRGDFRTAAKILSWARKIDKYLLESHFYLAKAYQKLGENEKAVEAFKELARLRPDLAEALINR